MNAVWKWLTAYFLLVDAFEGCMPQTRFVLSKALALDLKPVIVVNKVDRPNARPYEVVDEVLDLFIDLGATEEQLDTPVIYASGRDGWATAEYNPEQPNNDLTELFELIVNSIPCPKCEDDAPFQMLVSNIDYDDYTGRIAVGKIERGSIKVNMPLSICRHDGKVTRGKATKLFTFEGLKKFLQTKSVPVTLSQFRVSLILISVKRFVTLTIPKHFRS